MDIGDWILCIRGVELKEQTMSRPSSTKQRVEFVSYSGKYPNLCAGVLVLRVNGVEYTFPSRALDSGGSCGFSNNYRDSHINKGEWGIQEWPDNFPEELEREAIDVVNDNVDLGCCGGCL